MSENVALVGFGPCAELLVSRGLCPNTRMKCSLLAELAGAEEKLFSPGSHAETRPDGTPASAADLLLAREAFHAQAVRSILSNGCSEDCALLADKDQPIHES